MRARTPSSWPWPTLLDYLVERWHGVPAGHVEAMLREARIVDADGVPVAVDAPFVPRAVLWTQRTLRPEIEVPFTIELGRPHLTPAHRLDRLTAGVLVFTTEQRWRRAYQGAFADRSVRKEYPAVAPIRTELSFPAGRPDRAGRR